MGKNTRKQPVPRKSKYTMLPVSSPILQSLAKRKLIRKTSQSAVNRPHLRQIDSLINEEVLTCPICLQLLLSPVLGQCGHSFCLSCAEDLAGHGFACGICHTHQPTYDLTNSMVIQDLLSSYMKRNQIEEVQLYNKRKQALQNKQENRRIGQVEQNEPVDYWCEKDLIWKTGIVTDVKKNGTLTIAPSKGDNCLELHSSSRKLAPHHYFTKEEAPPRMSEVQIRPLQLIPSRNFETVRMPMNERPRLFGMPLLLGYYWRGNEEAERNGVFDGLDPFSF